MTSLLDGWQVSIDSKKKFNIRAVRRTDSACLLEWRNDALTIKNSLTGKRVRKKDHEAWFENVINSSRCKFFLATKLNHHPVGVVRYTMKKNKDFEIHINLNPLERGKGWGSQLIQACDNLLRKTAAGRRVVARVKEDNFPSRSVFEKAGYQCCSKVGGTLNYQISL